MEPTPEKIKQLKEQFPDRVLWKVNAVDGTDQEPVMVVVMTAPSKDEYQFFMEAIIKARDAKYGTELDRTVALRAIVGRAALAQIRWPDQAMVQKEFDARPLMVDNFMEELQKTVGSQIELRSKKL